MASLISYATGDFTHSSNTWKVVQSQGEIDNEGGTINISTSNIDSPTFVPTNTAHDGVALKISSKLTTGTFTVTLRNSTTSTDARSVTVNVSDLPSLGWVFFKFSSTVTPNGTDNYIVRTVCSTTGNQVVLFRSTSGTNNMSKKLRTNTTAAPGSNDHLVVIGERTGAGTGNAFTVTMDNTATTTWGPSSVGTQGVFVGQGGTLTCGTSTSVNYYFRVRGLLVAASGGVINFGTSGARIPASSTLTIEFDCVANNDSKIQPLAGGTINVFGAVKTPWTRLTANTAATTTAFTCDSTSGWNVGDTLAFSPTTTTRTQHETKVISTIPTSTTFTTTAGLSWDKSGTSPNQAFVLNLTRNVKLKSASTTNKGCVYIPAGGGDLNFSYVEVNGNSVGSNTTNCRPFDIQSTTNSVSLIGCCNDGNFVGNTGFYYVSGASADNFTIDSCVAYNIGSNCCSINTNTSTTNWTITNNVFLVTQDNSYIANLNATGGIVTYNYAIAQNGNVGGGFWFTSGNGFVSLDSTRFHHNEAWYNANYGFSFGPQMNNGYGFSFAAANLKAIRNSVGFGISGNCRKFELDDCIAMGNTNVGLILTHTVQLARLTNCTFAADTTWASLTGIRCSQNASASPSGRIELNNCTFGVVIGIQTTHTTADIDAENASGATLQVFANNTTFASSTTFSNLTNVSLQAAGDHINNAGSYLRAQRYNGTAGDHRTFVPQGVIKLDTSIYRTDSPSERLTPNSATYKLRGSAGHTPVNSGGFTTIKVWIRKSASGDGAAYNGNQPRMMLSRADAMGVTSDQVLATASGSTGSWEQLSGITPTAGDDGIYRFWIDCDGTAGWVNVDDWSQ